MGSLVRHWKNAEDTGKTPNGDDIAAALAAEFESDLDGVPDEHLEKLEVMNGVHSNAAGLHRWLPTRSDASGPGTEGP